ncbi:type II secretion system protein [Candidatus Woesebacteria bacterium]|nr:type II secretion system protein [Candidatus Woesebacteria bacterium]
MSNFTSKGKRATGFTLVELIVVIAIIGILATIGMSSYINVQKSSRDVKRAADIKEFRTAIISYVSENGTFPSNSGCLNGWCCLGHGDAGTCWTTASGYHGSTALDNSLSPYVDKIPDDPLNNTSRYGDAYMYRIDTDARGVYATLHWGIENSSPKTQTCAGGTFANWGADKGIGGNYYCMLIVR